MPRPYRARNKRIIHRAGNGRFRRSTLSDIGMLVCGKCGAIFTPDISVLPREGAFVDPFAINRVRTRCPECLIEEANS